MFTYLKVDMFFSVGQSCPLFTLEGMAERKKYLLLFTVSELPEVESEPVLSELLKSTGPR